jgi:hypothetical protein
MIHYFHPKSSDDKVYLRTAVKAMYSSFDSDLLPTKRNVTQITDACMDCSATTIAYDGDCNHYAGAVFLSDSVNGAFDYAVPTAMGWGIWVEEDWRGTGGNVAGELMKSAREKLVFIGIKKVIGQARTSNKYSRILMRHMGFKPDQSALILTL